MKTNMNLKLLVFFSSILLGQLALGQGTPDLLYYRFNEKGTNVTNLATSPPTGAATAAIVGNQSQTAQGCCSSSGLLGTGDLSDADYVDTKWATTSSGSWTISLWTNIKDTTTQYYLFGDVTVPNFRCIANGVAQAGNVMLRSTGMVDLKVTRAIGFGPSVITFVYNAADSVSYAYVNGKLNNTVKQATPIVFKGTGPLKIGGYSNFTGLTKGDVIDEFRWYTKALTTSEVSKLRYLGNTTKNNTLLLCDATNYKSPSGKHTWTKSGFYSDTMKNYYNCDSFMNFNLTFEKSTASNISPVACESYKSPSGQFTWTSSGVYTDFIKNAAGCDSNMTINLTINKNSSSSLKVVGCDSLKSPSGRQTWTKSGIFTDTIGNYKGCDSVITTDLTMYYSKPYTLVTTECNSYKSPSGKHLWTNSGTYYDTVPNKICSDSIVTVELTIIRSSAGSLTTTACNSYTSPGSKKTWTSSGTFMDTMKNVAGCDSFISLNLTINSSSAATINVSACERYESPSQKYVWNTSGTYKDTIQNMKGCDSVLSINLTINSATDAVSNVTACQSYESPSKKFVWNTSGTYMDTIQNSTGCDSVITFFLTINSVNVGVTLNVNTLIADATGAVYKWLDCNAGFTPISGQTSQSFKATVDGNYAVLVTENGCSDTSVCTNIVVVGITPNSFSGLLSVYPNPSYGSFEVSASNKLSNAEIRIMSVTGELVKVMSGLEGNDFTVDLSDKADGVYFIEIIENEKVARFKLLKY